MCVCARMYVYMYTHTGYFSKNKNMWKKNTIHSLGELGRQEEKKFLFLSIGSLYIHQHQSITEIQVLGAQKLKATILKTCFA